MKKFVRQGAMLLASVICVFSFALFAVTAADAHEAGGSNPWGYTLNESPHGTRIYDTPRGFCNIFNCVHNFDRAQGYVVECGDGKFSATGGLRNACMGHRGVRATLYAHPRVPVRNGSQGKPDHKGF